MKKIFLMISLFMLFTNISKAQDLYLLYNSMSNRNYTQPEWVEISPNLSCRFFIYKNYDCHGAGLSFKATRPDLVQTVSYSFASSLQSFKTLEQFETFLAALGNITKRGNYIFALKNIYIVEKIAGTENATITPVNLNIVLY